MKRKSVALVIGMLFALLSPLWYTPSASVLAAPSKIVEQWRGTMRMREAIDWSAHSPPVTGDTGMEYIDWESRIEFNVDEAGNVSGWVNSKVSRWAFQSDPGMCFIGPQQYHTNCWLTYEVVGPYSSFSVSGKRGLDANNQPIIDITNFTNLTTWKGHFRQSVTDVITGKVYPAEGYPDQNPPVEGVLYRWNIHNDGAGRLPIATHAVPDRTYLIGRDQYFEEGYLLGFSSDPDIGLDAELLERSIFLSQVAVDDRYDAQVDWGAAGGGWLDWTLGATSDSVGPSPNTQQQKHVDVGAQPLGRQLLTVEARNTLNQKSHPLTSNVTVAPPPASAGTPGNVSGLKRDQGVAYSWRFKFPEPAFEAQIKQTPTWLPFFGGKALGIRETQIEMKEDVLSTGDGTTEGGGQTGLAAMGGAIIGKVNVKGSAHMESYGPTTEGAIEFSLTGKLEKEEPLLKVVPPLLPIVQFMENVCPVCGEVMREHAKAKAEISLTGSAAPVFKDEGKGQGLEFKSGEFTFGPSLEIKALVSLIENVLEASIGAGGDASVTFQVPAPYFKEAGTKFKVFGKVIVVHFESGFEKTWEYKATSAASAQDTQPALAPTLPTTATWQLMDRSYLADLDYAHWQGGTITATLGPADLTLAQNVFPQAKPAIAAYNSTRMLVWSHDVVGSNALSGQDLMYSWTTGDGPACYNCATNWHIAKPITSDNFADLSPRVAIMNDSAAVAVWQRFDSANPGDFNTDPLGYLGHLQIGAAKWTKASDSWTAPKQLSVSGALSARPQVGALTTGALAVWVRNPANVLMGDAAHPDQVQYARYTLSNNSWTTATNIITSVDGLLSLSLATNGSYAALVYARDTDGDITTAGDRELFYTRWVSNTWTAPMTLTNNAVTDDSPLLALDASGNPLLVWRQDGALMFLSGGWAQPPAPLSLSDADAVSDSANLALTRSTDGNLLLTWQALHHDGTYLGYAIYDAAHALWGDAHYYVPPADPNAPAEATPLITHARAVLNPPGSIYYTTTARLLVGYTFAPLTTITETSGGITVPNIPAVGKTSLRVADVPLGVNLSITTSDLTVTPTQALPGEPLTITAVVHNSGDFATVAGISVTLRSWRPWDSYYMLTVEQTRTLPLMAAGSALTLTFNLTNPLTNERVRAVCIDGGYDYEACRPKHTIKETNDQDNMTIIRTEGALELLAMPVRYGANNIVAGALVSRSITSFASDHYTAALRLDSTGGPLLGQADFGFPLTPTAQVSTTVVMTAGQVGTGVHSLYWVLNPGKPEERVLVEQIAVLPDLHLSPDRVGFLVSASTTTTATFGAWVQNDGSLASTGGRLQVLDGLPGNPNSHELLSVPLPSIPALGGVEVDGVLHWAGLLSQPPERIFVVLDPDGAVAELDESNNLTGTRRRTGAGATPIYQVYLPLLRR